MKVYLYQGGRKIVEKSGVGRAMEHQEKILKRKGVSVSEENLRDCDVVQINSIFPCCVAAALRARLWGKRIVWYGHSTMEDFRNSFVGSNLLAPLFRRWITFCYRLGDVVVTPTPYSRDLLRSYGLKNRIIALSNGIDTDFWNPDEIDREMFREKYGLTPEQKAVISVGHMIERKGIIEYIELARRFPKVTFFWFGHTDAALIPGNVRKEMENAPKNLIFPGYVGKEELRRAYRGCDVFCFMSHEETEGIVVLEALACGIPTLVRDIPVYEGWLTDRENVRKCATDDEFALRLTAVLAGEGENLREGGFRVARERNFDAMGRELQMLYRELVPAIRF